MSTNDPPTVQLNPDQFQRIARALSDPNRWEMLKVVFAQPEVTCGDSVANLSITPGTASHHLHELEVADLISVTKCGRYKKLTPRRDIWNAYLKHLGDLT